MRSQKQPCAKARRYKRDLTSIESTNVIFHPHTRVAKNSNFEEEMDTERVRVHGLRKHRPPRNCR